MWPFTSSDKPPAPSATSDGAYVAPDRTSRDKCWAARDAFFACLDRAGIVDSIRDKEGAAGACGPQELDLRRECAQSWVTYFKQRRVADQKKKDMLEKLETEGAKPIGENISG